MNIAERESFAATGWLSTESTDRSYRAPGVPYCAGSPYLKPTVAG
jgi:hypothetical protein